MGGNPYQNETNQNTNVNWDAADVTPLDLNINDLHGFGKDMMALQMNMLSDLAKFSKMGPMASDAVASGGFPEGGYLADLMNRSLAEYSAANGNFGTGAANCGYAANTIADCYSGTDAMNAKTMNVDIVNFAFGDKSVPTPARLAAYEKYGLKFQTWSDYVAQQNGNDPNAAAASHTMDPGAWKEGPKTTNADGSVTSTFTGPNGAAMTMNVKHDGDKTITTTTFGQVITKETSTTTKGPDGKTTTTVDTVSVDPKTKAETPLSHKTTADQGPNSNTETQYYGKDHGGKQFVNRTTTESDTFDKNGSETINDQTRQTVTDKDGNPVNGPDGKPTTKVTSSDSTHIGQQPRKLTPEEARQDPQHDAYKQLGYAK